MLGLGSQAQLGLGIAVVLQDKFSGTANQIITKMSNMKNATSNMLNQVARDYQANATKIAAVAGYATYQMFNMAKDGAELSHKITQMLVLNAGKSREELTKIMGDVAYEFAQMPVDIGDIMLENIRAGARGALKELVRYQTAAAKIVGEPLGGEGGVGSGILGALFTFDFELTKENIARVTDAMVTGANISKASIRGIGETLRYAGFEFKEYGFSIEDAIAYSAKLSQANIEATSAGVAMNQMMRQLGKSVSANATKKQISAWALMGVDPRTVRGMLDQKNLRGVIELIQTATKDLEPVRKMAEIIEPLMETRGAKGALGGFASTVLGQNIGDFKKQLEAGEKAGITIKQGTAASKDPFSDIIRTQAQWEMFKMDFVQTISPELHMFATFLQKANVWMSDFSKSSLGSVVIQLAAVIVPTIAVVAAWRAAMIGMTFALKGIVGRSQTGGFRGIMQGLLANVGWGGTAGAGLKQNVAGRYYAGPSGFTSAAGKFYKSGQLVSMASIGKEAGAGMAGVGRAVGAGIGATTASGFMGKAGGFMSKAGGLLSFLPAIAGFLPELIPIGFAVAGIFELLKGESRYDQGTLDAQKEFSNQLQQAMWGLNQNVTPSLLVDKNNPFARVDKNQQLIINLNVDGQSVGQKTVPVDPNTPFQTVDAQFFH